MTNIVRVKQKQLKWFPGAEATFLLCSDIQASSPTCTYSTGSLHEITALIRIKRKKAGGHIVLSQAAVLIGQLGGQLPVSW